MRRYLQEADSGLEAQIRKIFQDTLDKLKIELTRRELKAIVGLTEPEKEHEVNISIDSEGMLRYNDSDINTAFNKAVEEYCDKFPFDAKITLKIMDFPYFNGFSEKLKKMNIKNIGIYGSEALDNVDVDKYFPKLKTIQIVHPASNVKIIPSDKLKEIYAISSYPTLIEIAKEKQNNVEILNCSVQNFIHLVPYLPNLKSIDISFLEEEVGTFDMEFALEIQYKLKFAKKISHLSIDDIKNLNDDDIQYLNNAIISDEANIDLFDNNNYDKDFYEKIRILEENDSFASFAQAYTENKITDYNRDSFTDNVCIELGYFMEYVKDDNKIESLYLSDGFTRSIPNQFCSKFKHLKKLDFSGNKLSEINDDFKLPNLEKLDLSDNIELKSLPENLFKNCPKLKAIDIRGCSFGLENINRIESLIAEINQERAPEDEIILTYSQNIRSFIEECGIDNDKFESYNKNIKTFIKKALNTEALVKNKKWVVNLIKNILTEYDKNNQSFCNKIDQIAEEQSRTCADRIMVGLLEMENAIKYNKKDSDLSPIALFNKYRNISIQKYAYDFVITWSEGKPNIDQIEDFLAVLNSLPKPLKNDMITDMRYSGSSQLIKSKNKELLNNFINKLEENLPILVFNKITHDPNDPSDENKTDELSQEYRGTIRNIKDRFDDKMPDFENYKKEQLYVDDCNRIAFDRNMAISLYLAIEYIASQTTEKLKLYNIKKDLFGKIGINNEDFPSCLTAEQNNNNFRTLKRPLPDHNDNVEEHIKKHKSDNEELLSALKNDGTKPTTSAVARNNDDECVIPKEPKIKNNKPDYIDNIFSLNNPSFQKIIDNLIELYNNKKSNRRNGNQIS